ncbi:MAG: hypothetical protein ACPGVO_15255 [Spirulinaceae cyanobacterium]
MQLSVFNSTRFKQIYQRGQFWTVVGLSCLVGGLIPASQAIASGENLLNRPALQKGIKTETPAETASSPQTNGLHFYGQVPTANAIGSDYLLYEVEGDRVTGIIFQPQSEFACFEGNVTPDGLELAIADPYDGTVYPYAIAFEHQTVQVAGAAQTQVTLAGLNAIAAVGELEQNLLAQCR